MKRGSRLPALTLIATLAHGSALWGSAARAEALPALMPVPAHVTPGGADLPVGGGFAVRWQGRRTPLLARAVGRFETRLAAVAGRGIASAESGAPVPLTITVGDDPDFLTIREKEAYRLSVSPSGVTLEADGPAGVLHGLATLPQLAAAAPSGPVLHEARIDDAPRFAWRGIMIDVARHFMSVETIERQIDAMELTKLNVLHWHLSDGTGFRVESLRYPKLQRIGGHHQYYTQGQVRAVVAYAAERGIRVVPEFDVPGHTLAILQAYPELAAQRPVLTPAEAEAALQGCRTDFAAGSATTNCAHRVNLNNPALDPSSPDVLRFAEGLFAEMGRLFPDRYFHSGGDEVVAAQWTGNPAIAAYMKAHGYADAPAMQAAFTARIERALARQGKIMAGWDEVSEAPIPKNVVVEVWRGARYTASATEAGHPVIVSCGYYLDLLQPARVHYLADPADTEPDAPPLSPDQEALILGGEAPLWSELVTDGMEDARLWPRAAAIAERFWSPRAVRDPDDMERRLPAVMAELEATGLQAQESRERMIARLTPANVAPLTVLTDATVPVRGYALHGIGKRVGEILLTGPAAIAEPDSFTAMRFNRLAARYAAGERGLAPELRAMLTVWLDNDVAYESVAATPLLAAAAPVSRALSELAAIGIEAMEKGNHGDGWRKRADSLLDEQERALLGPKDRRRVIPPSGLVPAVLPGLRALVGHA